MVVLNPNFGSRWEELGSCEGAGEVIGRSLLCFRDV
jgi:hypothetical protein